MVQRLNPSLLLPGLISAMCMACDGTNSTEHQESGTDQMFSRNKNQKSQDVIHGDVGATLQAAEELPQPAEAGQHQGMTCQKVRVDGAAPNSTLVADAQVQTPSMGFVITGLGDRPPLLVANSDEFRFDVWSLAADEDLTITRREPVAELDPEQGSWVGFYALGAACLPSQRVLLAVAIYSPRVSYALYTYDIGTAKFRHIYNNEAEIRDPYKFFEVKQLSTDSTLVLYYSDRVRKAAEIYHNYYHHFLLFTPEHPDGLEVLKLGIDTGNVAAWTVDNKTLYLQTVDGRDLDNIREGTWSLDLSGVLPD